jgi:hypothetical protein
MLTAWEVPGATRLSEQLKALAKQGETTSAALVTEFGNFQRRHRSIAASTHLRRLTCRR